MRKTTYPFTPGQGHSINPTPLAVVTKLAATTLVATLMLTIGSSSLAGVIALDSSLHVSTLAGYTPYDVTDAASANQNGTINSLGALSANAVSTSPGGTLVTSGSAVATWHNTASGQVKFDNVGWDNQDFGGSFSKSSVAGTRWSYTFQADVTGLFTINWDVSLQQALSQSFGLQDFRFSLAGAGGGQTLMQVDTTGTSTRNILAGNQYTALIETNAGIFGGVGGRTAFMDGLFDWSMDSGPYSSVPEPGSIALLSLGVLLLRVGKFRHTL